jgi:hypothetical protein
LPSSVRRTLTEIVVTGLGLVLLVILFRADAAWFKRHLLPDFFTPRSEQLAIFDGLRLVGLAIAAMLLFWVRPRLGRLLERKTFGRVALDIAPAVVAVALAVVAAELIVERLPWRAQRQAPVGREPVRHWDDHLGWRYVPGRSGHGMIGGRDVTYAFDAAGHRVRSLAEPVDYARPTIILAGESVMAGHGLFYDETIGARLGARTGYQTANLAVGGYATDQMYLRLMEDWPRFRVPAAVVVLFMPSLFFRSLDIDRPHLERGLTWRPPNGDPRLLQMARRIAPLHSAQAIAESEADVREQLAAIVTLARSRGAIPLIVVPRYGAETDEDGARRRRILDAAHLPYVEAPMDPTWRLKGNSHPDARGADAIARAVTQGLVARGLAARPR